AALVVVVLALAPSAARAADGAPPGRLRAEPAEKPKLGLAMLAGVASPVCGNQIACVGTLATSPTIQALVLYELTDAWAVGLTGQLTRTAWSATWMSFDGNPRDTNSVLTTGFLGLTTRLTFLSGRLVMPLAQASAGAAFQTQPSQTFRCSDDRPV